MKILKPTNFVYWVVQRTKQQQQQQSLASSILRCSKHLLELATVPLWIKICLRDFRFLRSEHCEGQCTWGMWFLEDRVAFAGVFCLRPRTEVYHTGCMLWLIAMRRIELRTSHHAPHRMTYTHPHIWSAEIFCRKLQQPGIGQHFND